MTEQNDFLHDQILQEQDVDLIKDPTYYEI